MNTLQNYRLCAAITAVGVLLVMLGRWMVSGSYDFNPMREAITLILLIWLATGSFVARWIVGVLTVLSVVVAVVGAIWLMSGGFDPTGMGARQQISLIVVTVAVAMYAFVAWRLLIWPKRNGFKKQNKACQGNPLGAPKSKN